MQPSPNLEPYRRIAAELQEILEHFQLLLSGQAGRRRMQALQLEIAVAQDGINAEATLPCEIYDQRYAVSRCGYLAGMYGSEKQARFVRLID
ncbi:hypothetical protein D9M73_269270 [compost metagenome]|nr:hypothetical protein TMM008_04520 [Pseudomonas sp. 008]